ncbi:MAG TPA: TatD family hydrolase [Flavipsychrobacter sp.]
MLPQYINIHTHHAKAGDALEIQNVLSGFDKKLAVPCSMGLHPWYLDAATIDAEMQQLKKASVNGNVYAIGECGLDKVAETDWILQVQAFREQVVIANELHKPLIIHCVRAYEEVLVLLKELQVAVPVIFHGFNKGLELAARITDLGYYLSFGQHLLKQESHAANTLRMISSDHFFLETDDSETGIAAIYEKAAALRQIPLDTLILQLQKRFKAVFRYE